MYIIEEGRPYIIKGKEAYGISFGDNGKMVINEKEKIEVSNQKTFSYDEIIRKFNVEYMVQQRKKELEKMADESEELKAIRAELEEVKSERDALKAELEASKADEDKPKAKEEK